MVLFYLFEIGSEDFALDFRQNFLPTWVALTILGSLSVSIGKNFSSTLTKVPGKIPADFDILNALKT